MNCRKVSHLISAYADGELPGMEHRAVHEHLRDCTHCRGEYVGILETKRLLGAMPLPNTRSEFVLTIMARIESEEVNAPKRIGFWQMCEEKLRDTPGLPQGAVVATGLAVVGVMMFGQRLNHSDLSLMNASDEAVEASPGTLVVPLQNLSRFSPVQALFSPRLAFRSVSSRPAASFWEVPHRTTAPSYLAPVNYLANR